MSQYDQWYPRLSRLRCEIPTGQRSHPARRTTKFDDITSPENLVAAFRHVRNYGGSARGPDRIHIDDIAMSDVWDLARAVSPCLQDHSYRPGDTRWIRILKKPATSVVASSQNATQPHVGPRRYRRIQISRLVDRIVSCAVQQAIGPVIERELLGGCYSQGGRGPLLLLAHLDHDIRRTGFGWIVNDDVSSAFDCIPKQYVVDCHRDLISKPSLMRLLESVIQGPEANSTVGITQGGATSPCFYTWTMHKLHDLAMARCQTPHWYRFVDNHLYLCRCEATARSTRRRAQQLLGRQGLTLKFPQKEAIINLRERDTELLGYRISIKAEQLHLTVDEKAWKELGEKLDQAHNEPRPLTVAGEICRGWALAYGPGIVDPADAALRMMSLLHQHCLGGATSMTELLDAFLTGREHWESLRKGDHTPSNERLYEDAGRLRRPPPRAEMACNIQHVRVICPPGVNPDDVPFDLSGSLPDHVRRDAAGR